MPWLSDSLRGFPAPEDGNRQELGRRTWRLSSLENHAVAVMEATEVRLRRGKGNVALEEKGTVLSQRETSNSTPVPNKGRGKC